MEEVRYLMLTVTELDSYMVMTFSSSQWPMIKGSTYMSPTWEYREE